MKALCLCSRPRYTDFLWTSGSYLQILPCIRMQMQTETHLELTPSIRRSLLVTPQGKPPELTHRRHIAPHAECFGLLLKRRRAGSTGRGPARPARLRDGLGLRRQRCHFCGIWIRPITSRAGKTEHHQNRPATYRKSQHLEQPLSRISEQDRKRQMWDTRKASSNLLQQQETGPIPLPTAPPAQHSPNAARPPAAIPGAALQGRRFACPAPGEMLV